MVSGYYQCCGYVLEIGKQTERTGVASVFSAATEESEEYRISIRKSEGISMFCTNCGRKNSDNAKFCMACGAKLDPVERKTEIELQTTSKKAHVGKNTKRVLIPAVILAAILATTMLMLKPKLIASGDTEQNAIQNFLEAFLKGDAEKLLGLLPENLVDNVLEQQELWKELVEGREVDESETQFIKEHVKELCMIKPINRGLDSIQDEFDEDFGEGWNYSYKILSSKNLSAEEIEEKEQEYAGKVDCNISEGKYVELELQIKCKGSESELDEALNFGLDLIKIEENWYVDIFGIDDI